jgi:uncharacterized membrane protein YkvA (DUF1232 family)
MLAEEGLVRERDPRLTDKRSSASAGNPMDLTAWKTRAKRRKSEIRALYLAARDPRTPWYAKVLAVFILGYALSPIDLIPDFIPILGYLDDLIVVPAGIAFLSKLIPREVMEDCRARAQAEPSGKRLKSWTAAVVIVLIWLSAIYLILKMVA